MGFGVRVACRECSAAEHKQDGLVMREYVDDATLWLPVINGLHDGYLCLGGVRVAVVE